MCVCVCVQVISAALSLLTPEKANLMLLSPEHEGRCPLREKWFGTQYSVEGASLLPPLCVCACVRARVRARRAFVIVPSRQRSHSVNTLSLSPCAADGAGRYSGATLSGDSFRLRLFTFPECKACQACADDGLIDVSPPPPPPPPPRSPLSSLRHPAGVDGALGRQDGAQRRPSPSS